MNGFASLGLVAILGMPAFSCTCAWSTMPPADFGASAVFRGTVTGRKLLPTRSEMKGRRRYEITFLVDETWMGPQQRTAVIYGLDNGTDCMGGSSYEVGKSYLVFAREQPSQDIPVYAINWWFTDVLPKGTPMLVPKECTPGGETSKQSVKNAIDQLGNGSLPAEAN
jgi:hypothetical protein